ncbi:PqqD family protein [Pseudoramibacter faecis]|uniref:PqqD family protein n=1 Tax=Pseudoramibacter faecis TaxID=3108534 RepID=UPI002E775CF0|nr:PqqD family protein [Pseudoramibacter sp. HA2172]
MSHKNQSKENYLDYVPRPNQLFPAAVNAGGHIEIAVQNKGFFNKIAQVVFKRPKVSHIELDDFGSFVWRAMDGERSIFEIGQMVKERFGEAAEPLYERLCRYIKTLHDNHYVVYVNKLKA